MEKTAKVLFFFLLFVCLRLHIYFFVNDFPNYLQLKGVGSRSVIIPDIDPLFCVDPDRIRILHKKLF